MKVERVDCGRASRSRDRIDDHDVHCRTSQAKEGCTPSFNAVQAGLIWKTMGVVERSEELLRLLCVSDVSESMGSFLYTLVVLGYVPRPSARPPRPRSDVTSSRSRSSQVEEAGGTRNIRPTYGSCVLSRGAYRCGGGWVRRHPEHRRVTAWCRWFLEVPRHLVLARSGNEHNQPLVKGGQTAFVGFPRQESPRARLQQILFHVENQAVIHITNSFVSASRPRMRELHNLKRGIDAMGFIIKSEWLPPIANKFADVHSRRFPRGDLQICRQVRRPVMGGMAAPKDGFPYRSLGENPIIRRRQALKELNRHSEQDSVRVLCPPVELISATVSKLGTERCPAILMVPDWQRQPWHSSVLRLESRVHRVKEKPSSDWSASRRLNPDWGLLIAEIRLQGHSRGDVTLRKQL